MATDYTKLITSEHKSKPKFAATVNLLAGAFGSLADSTMGLVEAFNVDTAVGAQLDVIGLWVGISRNQSVPIAGAFFTWNDSAHGWNFASWKGPNEPTQGIVALDDTSYRAVIKAKIGSNYWNGALNTLQDIGGSALNDFGVQAFVIDNMDMSITVYILGAPTAVLIEMIKRGITPPKPAGVRVTGYILASAPGAPFFALSVSTTTTVAGLDFGSFGDPV